MRQRLRELLEEEGSSESLQQLSKMQISTIHAFCHRAYADFGPSAGFPPVNGEPKSGEQIALQITFGDASGHDDGDDDAAPDDAEAPLRG